MPRRVLDTRKLKPAIKYVIIKKFLPQNYPMIFLRSLHLSTLVLRILNSGIYWWQSTENILIGAPGWFSHLNI